jgi:cellulose synthase/poly-beta-1,6-N-acetylglucosamine synthase-like glycosyltransferase
MEIILSIVFWCSVAGIVYAYVGYPIAIYFLSHVFGKTPHPPAVAEADLPRVALLIAAHNEAAVIEQRIHNAQALKYPRHKIEVVIASDGSDDGTAMICKRYKGHVQLLESTCQRGKAAMLNMAMEQVDAEIIILSDANTSMDVDSLRYLVRWFSDPDIGAVCGRLVLNDLKTGRNVDSLYWRYETFLKRCEGRLNALLGANGAIYAIRRDLFIPLPPGTVVDDFVIPLSTKLQYGCRLVYDPQAVAFEETAPDVGDEFRRRARIGTGGFQALGILWPLLSPRHGWTAFTLWSHKVLRWICPFLLIATLVISITLARFPVYTTALVVQLVFYLVCAVGSLLPSNNRLCRLLRISTMFASMNFALLVGCSRWLRGSQSGIWHRTRRSGSGISGDAGPGTVRLTTTRGVHV